MVVAGLFHFGRGAPIDGAVFLGTGAALAVAEVTDPRPPRPRDIPKSTLLVAIPAGWLIATWQPYTVPVGVAVALTGPPMLYLALRKGGHAERTNSGTWWPWAATGLAICLWELTSFLHQSDPAIGDPDHPTLSVVLDPVFRTNPWRTAMIIIWLAAGLYLLRLMLRRSQPCTR
jgi:hypothetical protein